MFSYPGQYFTFNPESRHEGEYMSWAPSIIKDDIFLNLENKQQPAEWIGAESITDKISKKEQPLFKSDTPWISLAV